MKITIIYTLVAIALVCNFVVASAYPDTYSIDKFDRDVGDLEDTPSAYDYRNSRLRRAYYFDDDYYDYYPYPTYSNTPIRRQDTDVDVDRAYKYTPLVRYKSTRTKRKKLFVPNLWG